MRLHLRPVATLLAVMSFIAAGLALPTISDASTITVRLLKVGSPGNPDVGIVPFTDAIYRTCADAPPPTKNENTCQALGGVDYSYRISQLEVTLSQWVKFLNVADPDGRNRNLLYNRSQSSENWPKYGAINLSSSARRGRHYSIAYPQWADKPYAFSDFTRAARFVNSLHNGRVLAKSVAKNGSFQVESYKVRLSPTINTGMYDLRDNKRGATRSRKTGFVVPSQDEWMKAAYYDPKGGGTYSYWKYPTNVGAFGQGEADGPNPSTLDANGNVSNASTQPLATYHKSGVAAPSWCPSQVVAQKCATENPFGLGPEAYSKVYQGSVGTVGTARTPSPWGTLDQGGNVVEWTDTITPAPSGATGRPRVWRRLHGGISNAPAYQLWISAIGLQPEDNRFFALTYPWLGIRVGFIGEMTVDGPDNRNPGGSGGGDSKSGSDGGGTGKRNSRPFAG